MKILKTLCFITIFGLMFSGCFTPGFTSASSYYWKISVTNVTENVFFTTILYDYSLTRGDFHEEWVHAILQREGYDPKVDFYNQDMLSMSLNQRFQLDMLYLQDHDEFGNLRPDPPEREDPYYYREPGKLVIWSVDSIGHYHIEYWPNNIRPKYCSLEEKAKARIRKLKDKARVAKLKREKQK